jgi:hypothetical protein
MGQPHFTQLRRNALTLTRCTPPTSKIAASYEMPCR